MARRANETRVRPFEWRTVGAWARVGILAGVLACSEGGARPSMGPSREPALPRPSPLLAVRMPMAAVASAIRIGVDNGHHPAIGVLSPAERRELATLYEMGSYAPLWVDDAGRPSHNAGEALDLLSGAAANGLDPADYRSTTLQTLATTVATAQPPLPQDISNFDLGVSVGMLRFLRHLHMGRVDPRSMGFLMALPVHGHDFGVIVRSAVADGGVAALADDLTPPLVLYRTLRVMLGRYRGFASDPALHPMAMASTVRAGEPYAGLLALHRRLLAFEDLPADTPPPGDSALYGGELVEGVKRFQIRHGLVADGVLGRDTQAALQIPLAWRVRQIELALERLRWLPHPTGDRFVAVNIPMFRLWAWDSIPPTGAPSFGMDVVVGRALTTRTPVLVEEMRYLIFRPYWNVPPGILRRDILPAIARTPDYLQKQNMEIVEGPGDDAQPVAATEDNLTLVRRGLLRVRQRPGATNAMGLVKFIFPNDENVYLHDTPATELFGRARRDFSNGCVRVEDAVGLAEWVLKDQPQWTRDRILAAMDGSRSQRVNLIRPMQVILFYVTAVVMPEDGTIRFAEDIYGHDARLHRALTQLRPVRAEVPGSRDAVR